MVQELDKKRIEQSVEPITRCGHIWLWCPSEGEHQGYWHNTTGNRKVRVFPSTAVLGSWLVQVSGNSEIRGFTGANAEECAFQYAVKFV